MNVRKILFTVGGVIAGALVGKWISSNGGYFPGLAFVTVVGGGVLGYNLAAKWQKWVMYTEVESI